MKNIDEAIKIEVLSIYYKFIFNSKSIKYLTHDNFIEYNDNYDTMCEKFTKFYNKLLQDASNLKLLTSNFCNNILPTISKNSLNNKFIKNILLLIKSNPKTYYDRIINLFSFTRLIPKSTHLLPLSLISHDISEDKIKVLVLEIYYKYIIYFTDNTRPNDDDKINYDDTYDDMCIKFDTWYVKLFSSGHEYISANFINNMLVNNINENGSLKKIAFFYICIINLNHNHTKIISLLFNK